MLVSWFYRGVYVKTDCDHAAIVSQESDGDEEDAMEASLSYLYGDLAKIPLRIGDEVSVLMPFDAPGRFQGHCSLAEGEAGFIVKMLEDVDGTGPGAVVRFEEHSGTYVVRGDSLGKLQSQTQALAKSRPPARIAMPVVVLLVAGGCVAAAGVMFVGIAFAS